MIDKLSLCSGGPVSNLGLQTGYPDGGCLWVSTDSIVIIIFSNNYVIQHFIQDGRIRSRQLKCPISHIVRDTRRKTKRTEYSGR